MDRLKKYEQLLNIGRHGFTLIELMLALAISSIVIIAIYTTFISQNKSYVVQERAVEMQQTLRSVFSVMERDIRMAGYDPDPNQAGDYKILTATRNILEFTRDEGGSSKTSKYYLDDTTADFDSEKKELYNEDKSKNKGPLAFNIDGLEFAYAYAYDSDVDGDVDSDDDIYKDAGGIVWAIPEADPSGWVWFDLDTDNDGDVDINDTGGGVSTGIISTNVPADIRMVRIWVLVRSSSTDGSYFNKNTYVVGSVHFTASDHYRRKLGTTIIRLRNIGL